jgi:hypothetical protein
MVIFRNQNSEYVSGWLSAIQHHKYFRCFEVRVGANHTVFQQ